MLVFICVVIAYFIVSKEIGIGLTPLFEYNNRSRSNSTLACNAKILPILLSNYHYCIDNNALYSEEALIQFGAWCKALLLRPCNVSCLSSVEWCMCKILHTNMQFNSVEFKFH